MIEIWKDIANYEGVYQVSNLGNIRSVDRSILCKNGRKKILKGKTLINQKYTNGYLFVCLSKNGVVTQRIVHRLVALAFLGVPEVKMDVNHINEIKTDNTLTNLEWVTHKSNINYGTAIKRRVENSNFKGENNPMFGKTGSNNTRSKPIIQKSLDGKFIKEFDSIASVNRELGFNNSTISGAAKGRYKTAFGYKWSYK